MSKYDQQIFDYRGERLEQYRTRIVKLEAALRKAEAQALEEIANGCKCEKCQEWWVVIVAIREALDE